MRVAHVVPGLDANHGGPSRSVPQLCGAIAAQGVDVTLLSTIRGGGGAYEISAVTISSDAESFSVEIYPWHGSRAVGALRLAAALARRVTSFDLVHIHSLWNSVATAAAQVCRARGIPYVIAPRGMLHPYCLMQRARLKRLYAHTLDRGVVAGATRLHFLNAAEAKGAAVSGFHLAEYFIAPNGVDIARFHIASGAFRARHEALAQARIIAFLGRLHPCKGLELQLEALPSVLARHPDAMWVLAGPDEGQWDRLLKRAEALGVRSRVLWLGPLHGIERFEFLADADVVVQTSHHECHSVAVNEALALGRPCVVTDTVHFDEIETSGAGCVVPRHAEALAAAVVSILGDEKVREHMSAAALKYSQESLTWDRIARTVIAGYEDVLRLV